MYCITCFALLSLKMLSVLRLTRCPCLPQVLLSVARQQRPMPSADVGRSGEADATPHRTTLKVSSCQAYDSLLMAALSSQVRGVLHGAVSWVPAAAGFNECGLPSGCA
jgi:hypothetical protein